MKIDVIKNIGNRIVIPINEKRTSKLLFIIIIFSEFDMTLLQFLQLFLPVHWSNRSILVN